MSGSSSSERDDESVRLIWIVPFVRAGKAGTFSQRWDQVWTLLEHFIISRTWTYCFICLELFAGWFFPFPIPFWLYDQTVQLASPCNAIDFSSHGFRIYMTGAYCAIVLFEPVARLQKLLLSLPITLLVFLLIRALRVTWFHFWFAICVAPGDVRPPPTLLKARLVGTVAATCARYRRTRRRGRRRSHQRFDLLSLDSGKDHRKINDEDVRLGRHLQTRPSVSYEFWCSDNWNELYQK